jgi:hypothetical protein
MLRTTLLCVCCAAPMPGLGCALRARRTCALPPCKRPRCACWAPSCLAQAQALDIRTALEASLATPGRVRAVVAVADAPAIQTLLGWCLESVAAAQQGAQAGGGSPGPGAAAQVGASRLGPGSIGAGFRIDEGSLTILNFAAEGATTLGKGVVLCSNFRPGGP